MGADGRIMISHQDIRPGVLIELDNQDDYGLALVVSDIKWSRDARCEWSCDAYVDGCWGYFDVLLDGEVLARCAANVIRVVRTS